MFPRFSSTIPDVKNDFIFFVTENGDGGSKCRVLIDCNDFFVAVKRKIKITDFIQNSTELNTILLKFL